MVLLNINIHQLRHTTPVKKVPTKADIRAEMEGLIAAFLCSGGEVVQVKRGLSGRIDPNKSLDNKNIGFDKPPQPRTSLGEVVSEIEARRSPAKAPEKASRQPRKKIIYDDFGEPLRWVWE